MSAARAVTLTQIANSVTLPRNEIFMAAPKQGLRSNSKAPLFYLVNIGLVDVGGVAAGETLNVSQTFQPAGRFSLANSP